MGFSRENKELVWTKKTRIRCRLAEVKLTYATAKVIYYKFGKQ